MENKKNLKWLLVLLAIILIAGVFYVVNKNFDSRYSEEPQFVHVPQFKGVQNENFKETNFPDVISLKEGTVFENKNIFQGVEYYKDFEPNTREVVAEYVAKIIPTGEDYFIEVNPGPSADYHLVFFKKENDEFVYKGSTPMGAIIPGNGFIYTGGSQHPFGSYSKFKLNSLGEIVKVKQPYQYSGMQSVALQDFVIEDDDGEMVATIAKGSPIELVLFYDDWQNISETKFLIKTQYNILGWYRGSVPSCFNPEEVVMEGLCWGGD